MLNTFLLTFITDGLMIQSKKDFQQLLLIRQMTEDLNFPVSIIGSPTLRTPEGLAMSSRNGRLSENERHRHQRFIAL